MEKLSLFISHIVTYIIQPLLALLFALALFFLTGGVIMLLVKSADPKERAKGRRVLLWGVIGMFIMVSAVSIIAAVTKSFCGTTFCTPG